MAYKVYRHRKKTNDEVFYVGLAGTRTRPWSSAGRNKFWHHVVDKHGRNVEIVAEGLTIEEAEDLEELMILEYGRRITGDGPLVNIATRNNRSDHRIGMRPAVAKYYYLDTTTGIFYDTYQEVADLLGKKKRTVRAWLDGQNKNKSNLIRV